MQREISQRSLRKVEVGVDAADRRGLAGRTQGSGFVAMGLDGDTLLLPQQDIESIESSLGLEPVGDDAPLAGYLLFADARWPVVCVGGDLEPLSPVPPNRRICLLLRTEDRGFGVLCDSIRLLDARAPRTQGLPACMAVHASPLGGLAVHDGKVVGVTSAGVLGVFLEQWRARGG